MVEVLLWKGEGWKMLSNQDIGPYTNILNGLYFASGTHFFNGRAGSLLERSGP